MIRPASIVALLVGLCAAGPALARIEGVGQGTDTDIPWIRLTAALLLCIGLAVGAALALNKRMNGGPLLPPRWRQVLERLGPVGATPAAARLTEIETRRLSPQVTVSVFKCDGRSFMVTTSLQGQMVLVALEDDGGDA